VQAEAIGFPLRRGHLKFERITLWTGFPFGVLRRVISIDQPGEMLVYPHLFRVNRKVLYRLARPDPSGRHRVERSGGTEEFYGVRDYRPGDSPKLIDWRRTARTGELITREMHHASPPKVVVALDLSRATVDGSAGNDRGDTDGAPRSPTWWDRLLGKRVGDDAARAATTSRREEIERAISLAASVVCDAHFRGYQTGLSLVGVAGPSFAAQHGVVHRTRMLEALARLSPVRPGEEKRVLEQPTVIIRPSLGPETAASGSTSSHPGNGRPVPGGARNGNGSPTTPLPLGGATVLTTTSLATYTAELVGGSAALLSDHDTRSRRQQLREGAP
jgi:uncharacterized protein (DUF58 family)